MNSDNLVLRLRDRGVIAGPGHFVVGDGYGNPYQHSSLYVVEHQLENCPELRAELLDLLIDKIRGIRCNGIIAASPQSLACADQLAMRLRLEQDLTELPVSLFDRTRPPTLPTRALIHDDIMNAGRQVEEVMAYMRSLDMRPLAITSLFTRLETEKLAGARIYSAVERLLPSYSVSQCPFCRRKAPIDTNYGKGKLFIRARQRRRDALLQRDLQTHKV